LKDRRSWEDIFNWRAQLRPGAVVTCTLQVTDVRRGVSSRPSQPVLSRERERRRPWSSVPWWLTRDRAQLDCVVVRCDVIVSLSVFELYFASMFCVLLIFIILQLYPWLCVVRIDCFVDKRTSVFNYCWQSRLLDFVDIVPFHKLLS